MADLHVAATVAARGLHVDFTVAAGEVLALLGPNGAGKSTTAAVLAGLLQADHAVVRVGERVLTDTERVWPWRCTPARSVCWRRIRCCSRT